MLSGLWMFGGRSSSDAGRAQMVRELYRHRCARFGPAYVSRIVFGMGERARSLAGFASGLTGVGQPALVGDDHPDVHQHQVRTVLVDGGDRHRVHHRPRARRCAGGHAAARPPRRAAATRARRQRRAGRARAIPLHALTAANRPWNRPTSRWPRMQSGTAPVALERPAR